MEGIGTVAAVGGIILALVLLYAVIANRKRSANDVRRTEEATRALNQQIDREDKVSDPDTKTF
ncbi:hypothetical protein [Sphingomonas bacterium]|uniref:hypothetical protein n=1 Tax=Sphingomonas bacterium TaxID=1895847 RepID=UPI001575BAA0|nr:hypothetical protein [Sphingomonas bacterium]